MEFIKSINFTQMIKKIEYAKIKEGIGIWIPEDWKKLDTWAMLFRRLVYIACFVCLVFIDNVIGSANGNMHGLRNYTGVVFAIIVLTAYKAKDFLKIPYAVWVVLFFILRPFLTEWISETNWTALRVEATVWNIGIYGIVFIRMFYLHAIERQRPNVKWPFFAIWLAMMVGMIFSVNDNTWYWWFLLIFGCFYLTNFSQKQLNTLFTGMIEGIILGFILLQGKACMYRPYDELRYKGMYANCNINALFYVISYLAVLGKWYLQKLKRKPFIFMAPYVLLGGSIWALTIFTMCRAALIAMAIFSVLFILFQVISRRKKWIIELVVTPMLMIMAIIFMFEPTYNVVRYLPAYVNSPIYVENENPEKKVQVDEAFDSEKYTEYDEMLEGAFGRISKLIEELSGSFGNVGNILLPTLQVNASETVERKEVVDEELRGTYEYPLLEHPEDYNSSVKIREAIYKYYWSKLNFKGHTDSEHLTWITPNYIAPHAHNIWLQLTYNHGWIVGILLMAIILLTIYTVIKGLIIQRQGAYYYRLFIVAGILVTTLSFGMFENFATYGYLSFTLLFMAFRVMCHRDEPKSGEQKGKRDEKERKRLFANTN